MSNIEVGMPNVEVFDDPETHESSSEEDFEW
jgi:hypothetical protein